MRSAVKPLLLLTFLLTTATNTWSAEGSTIRVEAMVGEAVVVFEDIDCPDDVYTVPTGEAAEANPVTCETLVALSTVPDNVGSVVWAIAQADPDDPAAASVIPYLRLSPAYSQFGLMPRIQSSICEINQF